MKRLAIFLSLVFVSSVFIFAQEQTKSKSTDEMAFEALSHDYGSVVYDADGTYKFVFTNNAKKPLVITNVKSSCGCTVPSWPKEPIQPGEKGSITVKYNTKIPGTFNKSVQVFSTAENSPVKLSIRGRVMARPDDLKSSTGNNLMNGTKIKEGVRQEQGNSGNVEQLTTSEQETIGGAGTLSKSKEARKAEYLKKLEEEKKKK
jgi:hypothetical protein